MAGHSKFANIKHKKEKNDAIRGKVFTRIGREIVVAVKSGGADPELNGKLKDIISKAKANNMPNDTIERSIKKASGELGSVDYERIMYEGYGPNGVAIMVDVLTDNRNRAAANVRNAFTKGNGNMGTSGCVSYMFEEKGIIMVLKEENIDEEELMMLVLDEGATDFNTYEEGYEITTEPNDFSKVRQILEKDSIKMLNAEITMIPQTYTSLETTEDLKKMKKLLDLLEEEDDVQNVWHNWEDQE